LAQAHWVQVPTRPALQAHNCMTRWRQGRGREGRRLPDLRCLAAGAAVSLLLLRASTAFLAGPVQGNVAGNGVPLRERQPLSARPSGPPWGTALHAQPSKSVAAPWTCLGAALLLAACARRALPRCGSAHAARGHRVVACQALRQEILAPAPAPTVPDAYVAPAVAAKPAPPVALSAPQPLLSESIAQSQVEPALKAVSTVLDTLQDGFKPTLEPKARLRLRPALFVGGIRHACLRHASRAPQAKAASRARAARRAVGARLQHSSAPAPVQTLAYDPSRVRTKVQVGLRFMVHVTPEGTRDFKTPSTSASLSNRSGVLLAGHFEIIRNEHERTNPSC